MDELCLKRQTCERIKLKSFFAFPPLHVTGNWCKRLHRCNHITEIEMLMFGLGFHHHRPVRSDLLVLKKNNRLDSCIMTFSQAEVNQLNQTGNLVHQLCNQREAIALKISGLASKQNRHQRGNSSMVIFAVLFEGKGVTELIISLCR